MISLAASCLSLVTACFCTSKQDSDWRTQPSGRRVPYRLHQRVEFQLSAFAPGGSQAALPPSNCMNNHSRLLGSPRQCRSHTGVMQSDGCKTYSYSILGWGLIASQRIMDILSVSQLFACGYEVKHIHLPAPEGGCRCWHNQVVQYYELPNHSSV